MRGQDPPLERPAPPLLVTAEGGGAWGGGAGGAGAAGGGVVVVLRLWLWWVVFRAGCGCASRCVSVAIAGCSKRAMTRALLLPRARDCPRGCCRAAGLSRCLVWLAWGQAGSDVCHVWW